MIGFRKILLIYLLIIIGVVWNGCARHLIFSDRTSSKAMFHTAINRMLNDRSLKGSIWGILAYSISRGDTLFHENPDMLLVPASNSKIITSAAAYHFLGPDYRYTTTIASNGTVDSTGTLNGNLYIIGSGDPTLASQSLRLNPVYVMKAWADSLRKLNIRAVNGDIVGLDTCFKGTPYGEGWELDDISYSYGAPSSGLCFSENCSNVLVSPGNGVGKPGILSLWPPNTYFKLKNYTSTSSYSYRRARISLRSELGDNLIRVYGTVPLHSRTGYYITTVSHPAAYTASVFLQILKSKRIKVSGKSCGSDELLQGVGNTTFNKPTFHCEERIDSDNLDSLKTFGWPAPQHILVRHQSPPLKEILDLMNKSSKNIYAEQVLKTIGKEVIGDGSLKGGRAAIAEFMTAAGVDSGTYYMADGSGLSRHNLLSAGQMFSALAFMTQHDNFEGYLSTLAMPGEEGTLKNRFIDTPVFGKIFAKTGTLQHIRALSGYLRTQDGELYAFSIIVNNFTCHPWKIIQFQNNFCSLLAQFNWHPNGQAHFSL